MKVTSLEFVECVLDGPTTMESLEEKDHAPALTEATTMSSSAASSSSSLLGESSSTETHLEQRRVNFRSRLLSTHEEILVEEKEEILRQRPIDSYADQDSERWKKRPQSTSLWHSVIHRITNNTKIPWSNYALPTWRAVFALLAIADAVTCWPVWMQGWTLREQEHHRAISENDANHSSDNNFTDSHHHHKKNLWDILFQHFHNATTTTNGHDLFPTCANRHEYRLDLIKQWIALLFCGACLVEALLRAREAQILAIHMAALDHLERRLTRAYNSTTRMWGEAAGSFRIRSSGSIPANSTKVGDDDNPQTTSQSSNHDENTSSTTATKHAVDQLLAQSTLRTWIPVMFVLCFWISLMPLLSKQPWYDYTCGQDQALATLWITQFFQQYSSFAIWVQDQASTLFWRWAMPYNVFQPQRLINRARYILRWIRYARFAGPLFRMCLKLGDQVINLLGTRRQQRAAQSEKDKRIRRPSILFADLKKIESLTKVQTALARIPSQMILLAQEKSSIFGRKNSLEETRAQGQKWKGEIEELKLDLYHRQSLNESVSDLYDRVVKLTHELQLNLNKTVLSNPRHLISPHSRFGLLWRITVTNCFLLELFRLTMSWHLSGTFKISFRRIISKMLVECDNAFVKNKVSLKFLHNIAHGIHKHLSHLVPILPPPEEQFVTCMPSSTTSALFLEVGSGIQHFIDLVGFMDIFIWFFTGELDVNGLVRPKPFFYRCILPGTLSQVLDHPTLPDILPALTARFLDAASTVGWSRMIRWYLAIIPAVVTLIINPLESYFIGTVGSEKDPMIMMAESVGVLAPIPRTTSVPFHLEGLSNDHLTSDSSEIGLSMSTRCFDVSERGVEDEDQEPIIVESDKSIPDLPPPRPLWSRNNDALDDDVDDSYSFDYTALPIAY